MKQSFLVALLLVVGFSSCGDASPKIRIEEIAPLYAEKWPEIENHIKNGWADYIETSPNLPKPYLFGLNPGTLYYWDVYFHNEGLMRHGLFDVAKNNLDCFIYQINQLGFAPCASGWGHDRSQTPCFSMSVRNYYDKSPEKDTAWLREAYNAVFKEYRFWTNMDGNAIEDHTTPIAGLHRYGHHSDSAELVTFYDRVLRGRFGLEPDVPVAEKLAIANHRMAETETMDFTPRFEGRCLDFIPVDLNSYLWQYEMDLAYFEKVLGIKTDYAWEARAKQRAALLDQYCWSEERGMYLDYDFVNKRHSSVACITTFMPMYWGFAPKDKALRITENLPLFDSDGGLVTCEVTPQEIVYQWGDASVWAPIQHIGMEAIERYGYHDVAKMVAMKWLNTVTKNYVNPIPATHRPHKYGDGTREPGFLWEKYKRDGTINDDEYPCSVMMGWTASAYLVALEIVRK